MFPQAVRAVRELKPKAFIFENVKGLLRSSFTTYLEYTLLQLANPHILRKEHESWEKHLQRLEKHHTRSGSEGGYNVVYRLLNAANFGVPQKRERVFIVGFRSDLGIEWTFPDETHSESAMWRDQWVTHDYWDRHKIAKRSRPPMPERVLSHLDSIHSTELEPWQTVRDAICDLPDPVAHPANTVPNHIFTPGARSYPGHTGSRLDEPAKTLKAGDHGVPGGENMILRPDGSVRYFTVREAARLQTFADDYVFPASWTRAMRQIGNAVPVRLAEVVAKSVASKLARR
jgi:DNA (cytosine-5)-methyltransferase 1